MMRIIKKRTGVNVAGPNLLYAMMRISVTATLSMPLIVCDVDGT